jgi:drug/metabolite transporter (DMT)-like permease
MMSVLEKLLCVQKRDYRLIFRRKLFWILIPGLLAGLLAVMLIPNSRGVPNGPKSEIAQSLPGTVAPKVENLEPNRLLIVPLAIIVGLVMGIGLALFSELKDGSSRSESDLTRLTGVPVLASIPIIQDQESALPKDRRRL